MSGGVRFGTFELDLHARELRKGGIRLRLPNQSLEILAMLVDRPGEIISREEIRERLWPHGTIVEFEHSVGSAINRLSDALGDPASNPRFIETVPRRGYRFVAPVDNIGPPPAGAHYRILGEAGRGAMGVVYRAEDLRLGRTVALKFLPDELAGHPPSLERLRQEARTAASLNHPGICTLYGLEEHKGRLCLEMEYLEGRPLSRLLENGPLKLEQALEIAIQAAEALAFAHSQGIVHRDIKPGNLFVTGSGKVKLTDFGIATRAGSAVPQQAGTPEYMSPEQARGEEVDARSDIYSFGAVLHEMLTGRRAVLAPTPLPGLPREIANLVRACLQPELSQRIQQMNDVKVALEDARRAATILPGHRRKPLVLVPAILLITAAVAFLVVMIAGNTGRSLRQRLFGGPPRIDSIAVMPLANLSGGAEEEYFSEGMTEELITALSQIRALRVISRTSVMRYKGMKKSVPEIGRELSVDAVVEGSVQRSGGKIRITAQLIHAPADRNLWAKSFDRDLKDVLALQNEVARAIATEVRVELTPQDQARLGRAASVDPRAFEAFLRGRYFRGRLNFRRAVESFEEAVRIEPGHALAWALLGDSDGMLTYGLDQPRSAKGLAAMRRAEELDPNLAEVHINIGDQKFYSDWNWAAGEAEFRRAVEINPGSVDARGHHAVCLEILRRRDEAIREAESAHRLDPLSTVGFALLGRLLRSDGQYERADKMSQKALELDPAFAGGYAGLGATHEKQGRDEQAVAAYLKSESLLGRYGAGELKVLEEAFRAGGMKAYHRKDTKLRLEWLKKQAKPQPVPPYHVATLYAMSEDWDQAFHWLEQAYQRHSCQLPWVNVESYWNPIRSDPRFQDLLRRMNFPR
jgi:serine/threonine-protein kinase